MKYLFDENFAKPFDFSISNPIIEKILKEFDNNTEILDQSVYNLTVTKSMQYSPPVAIEYQYFFKYKQMLHSVGCLIFNNKSHSNMFVGITYAKKDAEQLLKECGIFHYNNTTHMLDIKHTKLYKHLKSVQDDMYKELDRYLELNILE